MNFTGWDRFLTQRKRLSIPLAHIKSASVGPRPRLPRITQRNPNYRLPGRMITGSIWSSDTNEWSFWNVRKSQRVVVIELNDEMFARLVLEVAEPERLVELLRMAKGGSISSELQNEVVRT